MRANPNESLPQHRPTFVKPGSLLVVTIGRNVGIEPMSDARWSEFQDRVIATVRRHFAHSQSFGPFYGVGEWDGVTEESAVLTFLTSYPGSTDRFAVDLAELSSEYDQDAIAWSFGPANLAGPRA